jgi:hypothetical protein
MAGYRPNAPGVPLDLVSLRSARESGPYAPGEQPGTRIVQLTIEQLTELLRAIWKRGELIVTPFLATNAGNPQLIRPAEGRSYCMIQNQSGGAQIFVNFGRPPGPVAGAPIDAFILGANLGFYEPIMVPQNEIYVSASAAATPGVLVWAR